MTDRENIRAYIEKLHQEHRGSEGDSIFRKALRTVLFYIDSMQEVPSEIKSKCMYTNDNYTDEDRKVLCDGCEEDCKYNKKEPVSEIDFEQELYKAFGHVKDFTLCLKIARRFYEMGRNYQEPVSEDLEKIVEEIAEPTILNAYGTKELARRLRNTILCGTSVSEDLGDYINELSKQFPEVSFAKLSRIAVRVAKWHKQQFEKNRLKYCNSITNEQAELEQKFLDQHLDKYNRMPGFLDAIEYGMRLKEKEMQSTIELAEDHAMLAGMEKMKERLIAKAVDVTVHIEAGNYPYIPQIELYDYDKDIPLAKEGDRYKVILIKED